MVNYIGRDMDRSLLDWKKDPRRRVLLLRGARQVGKTSSVRDLGRGFDHFLEVNLELERPIHAFFKGSLEPAYIDERLSTYFGVPIVPGRTLLFFDEIQACPDALRALRFYHEKMPDLHVVAAGSLLEFVLSEIPSLGVGRLSNLFLYPLSFGEFLEAVGEGEFRKMFLAADAEHPLDNVFHNRLLERLRIFQILGGMPAVVDAYRRGEEVRSCQEILSGLLVTLRDDFAKYKKKAPVLKLREVFESIPLQAGGKFKFARITEAATSTGYSEALDLLVQAGLAYKVYHSTARGIPLGAQINPKKFKMILLDGGLHQCLARLDISSWLVQNPVEMIQKGPLSELFAGLELVAHAPPTLPPQLYYWHRESPASNAEVDYLLQKGEQIVPIEVKAGTKGQMQSLFLFLRERGLPLGIRLSHENFGRYDKIITVPLYAAERLFSGELR